MARGVLVFDTSPLHHFARAGELTTRGTLVDDTNAWFPHDARHNLLTWARAQHLL